jgi:Bacterial PH domain
MSVAVIAVHYLLIARILTDSDVALVLALVTGTWILVILRLHKYVGGWLGFFIKDSAYGVITESGIQYRSILRSHFVPWSSVARIEYSPRNGDRIDVFKIETFSFSRERPIQFGAAPSNSKAIQDIERILNQQGATEKLVTTDSVPEKFFHM